MPSLQFFADKAGKSMTKISKTGNVYFLSDTMIVTYIVLSPLLRGLSLINNPFLLVSLIILYGIKFRLFYSRRIY